MSNTPETDMFLQQQGIHTKSHMQSSDPVYSYPSPTSRSSVGQSACGCHPPSLQRTHQADCHPESELTPSHSGK